MISFKSKKAILWDNDGVLVDTEKYFFEAARMVLEKEGIAYTLEMYTEFVLSKATGPWHLLKERGVDDSTISKMKEERDELYIDLLKTKDILIDGVEDVLRILSRSCKMGIVTSSKPEYFYTIHSRTRLLKYFNFVVTPDDYNHYKPHPEPYLIAWEKTNLAKDTCVVIEDSRRGLMSAFAAGLDCVIIPNKLTAHSDFKEAVLVLNNVSELLNLTDKK